jgi:hypothetical protein
MYKNKTFIRSILIILFILLLLPTFRCQVKDGEKDSLRFYKKIKSWSDRYYSTRWLYQLVFVNPEPREYPLDPASKETKNVNPYMKDEKKIIRNIHITVHDPFGNSIYDTACKKLNFLERFGNRVHVTSRRWIIINRLLFKQNDSLNPLTLSETERLLRSTVFVNDAKIFVTKTGHEDSVDVNLIIIDSWPVTIPTVLSQNSGNSLFRNQNLFGLGQQFQQFVSYTRPDTWLFSGFYNIANIDNTYMSSQLGYSAGKERTLVYLNFNRPFFSPLVKWSYGANFSNLWSNFSYTDSLDSVAKRRPLDLFSYDLWLSRSFKLSQSKSLFNQSTNIIVGFRQYSNLFIVRPPAIVDKNKVNAHQSAILGNVGFAVQQYYKDKYIYRFGANEDVPEGLIVQLVYGAQKAEYSELRYFVGTEIARAKHFKVGYFSATYSHGVFFAPNKSNDITTNFKLFYFSNLIRRGRWLFRQFFNYNLVYGANKMGGERIKLTSEELYGFQSQSLTGTTKMLLNSETVAYAPFQLIGFRFAPVLQIGAGAIGDSRHRIVNSRLYQGYTLGLMVRNENLLTSTFQFSFGMYPFFPDAGDYKFIYNPITSFTLRVRAFTVSRPEFVSYW